MVKVLISGIGGRLGRSTLQALAKSNQATCIGGLDILPQNLSDIPTFCTPQEISVKPDVVIDFSHFDSTDTLVPFCVERKIPLVICTTGHTQKQQETIQKASKIIPIFKSANVSLGVSLLIKLAKLAKVALPEYDIEIIETHHNIKKDSPSGTALMLANSLNESGEKKLVNGRNANSSARKPNELGIHAVRGGSVIGKHEVLFLGQEDTITLTHEAQSKQMFAEGAIKCAIYLTNQPAGLYNMEDLV